jgi:hypothetical protein
MVYHMRRQGNMRLHRLPADVAAFLKATSRGVRFFCIEIDIIFSSILALEGDGVNSMTFTAARFGIWQFWLFNGNDIS